MKQEALKPCPFCADDGKPERSPSGAAKHRGTVTCQKCKTSAHVCIWNARAHDSAHQEKLREVRNGLAEAIGIYETDGDSDQRIRRMYDEVVLALSIIDGMITGEQ